MPPTPRISRPAFAYAEITPAYDGIDTDSAPEAIGQTRAPLVENFLVDRPGKLPMRGPVNGATSRFQATAGYKPIAAWRFNNSLLVPMRAVQAGDSRDPWVAPYRRAPAGAGLSVAGGNAYYVDLDTAAVSVVAVTAAQAPGHAFARLGAYCYGLGFDAATSTSYNGGFQKNRAFLRWGGTAAAPTVYTNAPSVSQAIAQHYSRIFVGGGIAPGGATYQPNAIYWTDEGGPTTDTLAMWQDDITGLTNQILVDDDGGDFIVGFAHVGRNLAIFKRRSIHVLYGYSPATFSVRRFTAEQGCIDPRSIIEYQDGCFFMSEQGFMWFDGSRLTNVSPLLRSSLLASALMRVGNSGQDGGFVIASRLSNGYCGVSAGITPPTTNASTVDFSALFSADRQAWVYFSSDALVGGRPLIFGSAQSHAYLVDDEKVITADKITVPESEDPALRGFDTKDTLFMFDAYGGGPLFNGTGNTLKNQLTGVEMFPNPTPAPIRSRWWSRLFQLSDPLSVSALHRFLIDYAFKVYGDTDGQVTGWDVQLIDGHGTAVMSLFSVPAQGYPTSGYNYRRQATVDNFNETIDVQLRVEWNGPAQALPQAEVYNSLIEYQPGRQRRSA